METTSYNAIVDIGVTTPDDAILDALTGYHAVLSSTAHGTLEVVITLPAEDLRQAATTALAVVAQAIGRSPRAIHVLTTEDYDAGLGTSLEPETVSVNEAALILGVTPSAVRQRLALGTLPGRRVGRDWRVPRLALDNARTR